MINLNQILKNDYFTLNNNTNLFLHYFKCKLKFKILQLIPSIVETDNNDVCVRDVETQMQKVHFRIADMQKHVHLKFSAKMTTESFAVKNKYFK